MADKGDVVVNVANDDSDIKVVVPLLQKVFIPSLLSFPLCLFSAQKPLKMMFPNPCAIWQNELLSILKMETSFVVFGTPEVYSPLGDHFC